MADVDQTTEDEQTQGEGEQSEEGQSVDVEAITKEITEQVTSQITEKLEAKYKAEIAGRDRKIADMQKEHMTDEEKREQEAKETREMIVAERRARVVAENRSLAVEMLNEAGITRKPLVFDDLIKDDPDETKASVERFIEDRKVELAEVAKERDRKNGRTVTGPTKTEGLTWDKFLQMSDAEQAAVPPNVISKLTQEAASR